VIQVPTLGTPQYPFSVVEHGLLVLELLLTSTVTTLPYRGLLLLDPARLDRLLHKTCYAQHGQEG
jgi:hypothetical protein